MVFILVDVKLKRRREASEHEDRATRCEWLGRIRTWGRVSHVMPRGDSIRVICLAKLVLKSRNMDFERCECAERRHPRGIHAQRKAEALGAELINLNPRARHFWTTLLV